MSTSRMLMRISRFFACLIFAVSYYGPSLEAVKFVGALIFVFYIIPFIITCIVCRDNEDWYDGEINYHTDENGDTDYQLRIYNVYELGKSPKIILKVDDKVVKEYKVKE